MKRALAVLAAVIISGGLAKANTLYSNGFEPGDPGTSDFYDSTVGGAPNMTVVASGGGINAASGNYYGVINNVPDTYLPGYGESAYTDYGAARNGISSGPSIPISGGFYESSAFYINTAWSTNSTPTPTDALQVDTTPDSDPGYNDETEFRVYDGGNGNIDVVGLGAGIDSSAAPVVLSSSGWYTFVTTFQDDGGDVENLLSVLDSNGNVLGTFINDPANFAANYSTWSRTPLAYADLDGPSYGDWIEGWTDGFAGNTLDIDNVEVGTLSVPLPASVWSGLALLGGLGLLGSIKRLRKQMA